MLVMIVALLTIAAALWFMGDAPVSDFSGVSHRPGAWAALASLV